MKFIARPNTYFDEGTELVLVGNAVFEEESLTLDPAILGNTSAIARMLKSGLFQGYRSGQLEDQQITSEDFDIVE